MVLVLALVATFNACLASGEIKGIVTDSLSGKPLEFASVAIDVGGMQRGTSTDEKGYYSLKPLEAGMYILKISYVGYKTLTITNVKVYDNRPTYINVQLSNSTTLGPAIIRAQPEIISPWGPIQKIDANSIESSPLAKQPKDMVALMPGVTQDDQGGELYFRGSRSGSVIYYVDGEKITDGGFDIVASSIAEISVYNGNVPAQYGDCTGGVIVITTKSYQTEMARRRIKYSNEE